MHTEPITPKTAKLLKLYNMSDIPSFVFDTINAMIAERFNDGAAKIKMNELMDRLGKVSAFNNLSFSSDELRSFLDVEVFYRQYGWDVMFECTKRDGPIVQVTRFNSQNVVSAKMNCDPATHYFLFSERH